MCNEAVMMYPEEMANFFSGHQDLIDDALMEACLQQVIIE